MSAESLAAHLRSLDAGDLRTVIHYDGDQYDTIFRSGRVEEAYTGTEFHEVTKNLILKALDDSHEQPEFGRFGHLDATVRWFQHIIVLQIPLDEWSGILVAFDRDTVSDTGRLVDEILTFVDGEFHDSDDESTAEESFAGEFDQ